MNPRVVWALTKRYLYLYTHNPIRATELIFWPIVALLVMGFLTVYLQDSATGELSNFIRFLIGAVIFWDVLFRSQQAVAICFLEDVWTRNLLNIFVAPVRIIEYLAATFCIGIIRVSVTVLMLYLMARLLYSFDLLELEWSLFPFLVQLMVFGWCLGMISTALIMRWGQAAEGFAWAIPYLIQPFSAVFYPVSVMPVAFQVIAWLIPSTYIFEGMRTVMGGEGIPWGPLAIAAFANLLFALGTALFFGYILKVSREKGLLTRIATQ